jgi:hypothetical protein
MKKILVVLGVLSGFQVFAQCPDNAVYITGDTILQGSPDIFIFSSTGTTINTCTTNKNADPTLCAKITTAKRPGFAIDPPYVREVEDVKDLIKSKKMYPFEACATKTGFGDSEGLFGATKALKGATTIVIDSTTIVNSNL